MRQLSGRRVPQVLPQVARRPALRCSALSWEGRWPRSPELANAGTTAAVKIDRNEHLTLKCVTGAQN